MKSHRNAAGVALLALTALLGCNQGKNSSGSGEPVTLAVKWPVGTRYVYRMDLDQQQTNRIPQMPQPMQQHITMGMTYAIAVLKETEGGGRELEMEFVANEMEVRMGEQVMLSFDSKQSADNDAQTPFAAPFRKMIGSKLKLVTDRDGHVDKVDGIKEWVEQVAGQDEGSKAMLSQQFNEGYFRQIADYGRGFLTKPVKPGESWPFKLDVPMGPMGTLSLDMTVKFKEWGTRQQLKCAVLETTGTMKGSPAKEAGPMGKFSIDQGKVQGTAWFDPEGGKLIESLALQNLKVSGEIPGQGGNDGARFTSEIGQKVSLKLVEQGKVKG